MPKTVPAAKAALLALLTGIAWTGNQPEVRYGQPTEDEDLAFGGETVFLGESRATAEPPGLGNRRDETYVLRYVIDVRQEGDTEQDVEERAWVLASQAEDAIWADPTVGGSVNRVTRVESFQVNQPLPGWWRSQIVCDVSVTAAPVF